MTFRVFAYGSNMHVPDLRAWMQRRDFADAQVLDSRAASLVGWELVWDYRSPARAGGAANVRRNPSAVLPGVLLDVDERGLAAIDRKEGHPGRYDRGDTPVEVRLVGAASLTAWLYVVTDPYRQANPVLPRSAYVALMIEGALAHSLPAWHIQALRQIETTD